MVLFVHIVKNQKNDFNSFFVQCMIRQLLDSVFAIPQNNRGLGSASLITLTSTLINLDITKILSFEFQYLHPPPPPPPKPLVMLNELSLTVKRLAQEHNTVNVPGQGSNPDRSLRSPAH